MDENGKAVVDRTLVLRDREMTIPLDTSQPFKLNAGTTGVCKCTFHLLVITADRALDRVLYTPERLEKIAKEAAKENSVFSLNDRLGLVHDAMALSKAGLTKISSALSLVEKLKHEKECKSSSCWVNID